MRIRHRFRAMVLLSAYLIFLPGISFAQNADARKFDIYSRLKCCTCRVSFDKCDCPEAKEMKAYVDALMESGIGRDEIFYRTARKFSLNAIEDKQIRQDIEKRLIKEAGVNRPQIVPDAVSYNLGTLSKKSGKVSRLFKLSNKGNALLVITQIKTSCPCAAASLKTGKDKSPYFSTEGSPAGWQSEIKPGQSGELELMVDLSSPHVKTGKLVRDAAIISNDPVYPQVAVRIEAEVTD